MAGINDLPVEVLGFIFSLIDDFTRPSTLQLGSYLICSNGFQRRGAPFTFLQVCSHWRSVAEGTPLLWSSLDVSMRKHITRATTARAALQHWLSLSRHTSLDFFLAVERYDKIPEEIRSTHASDMLRIVANESHRWRSAAFDGGLPLAGVLIDMLLNKPNTASFLTLTRLEIVIRTRVGDQIPIESLASAIGTIKSLTELCLDFILPEDSMSSLLTLIPWRQLTSIHLGITMSMDQVAFLLSQSTAAVSATFTDIEGTAAWGADEERYTLPQLKSLTLDAPEPSLWTLLDRFSLPALENLSIACSSIAGCDPLERLIEQSKPRIQQISLRLHGRGGLRESHLAKFLRIPTIRHVSHVEFDGWDVLETATRVMAQLKNEVPDMWTWRSWMRGERVGWKPQFDYLDKYIKRIIPAPQIL